MANYLVQHDQASQGEHFVIVDTQSNIVLRTFGNTDDEKRLAEWVADAMSIGIGPLPRAAAGMLDALRSAEIAVEQLCHGQDPANQCWVTLAEIKAAIAKAEGR